jgi:hypothetical protein
LIGSLLGEYDPITVLELRSVGSGHFFRGPSPSFR